jgi:hypothetical protein
MESLPETVHALIDKTMGSLVIYGFGIICALIAAFGRLLWSNIKKELNSLKTDIQDLKEDNKEQHKNIRSFLEENRKSVYHCHDRITEHVENHHTK